MLLMLTDLAQTGQRTQTKCVTSGYASTQPTDAASATGIVLKHRRIARVYYNTCSEVEMVKANRSTRLKFLLMTID